MSVEGVSHGMSVMGSALWPYNLGDVVNLELFIVGVKYPLRELYPPSVLKICFYHVSSQVFQLHCIFLFLPPAHAVG